VTGALGARKVARRSKERINEEDQFEDE
jgi:hypothetical protein